MAVTSFMTPHVSVAFGAVVTELALRVHVLQSRGVELGGKRSIGHAVCLRWFCGSVLFCGICIAVTSFMTPQAATSFMTPSVMLAQHASANGRELDSPARQCERQ